MKLVVPGQYWDSQLYEGWLYLFGRAGDILALDWDRLIGSLKVKDDLQLALKCAFQRSDYLYGIAAAGLMQDREIRNVIRRKFSDLQKVALAISPKKLEAFSVGRQDNPLPFPHTDSEIYGRKLYVSAKSGVQFASCNKKTKLPVSTRATKIWDAPSLGIAASYGSLALAAGSDGLFEKPIKAPEFGEEHDHDDPKRLSQDHCSDCGWAYYSIYGSSSLGGGHLVSYVREPIEDNPRYRRRRLEALISDNKIFGPKPGAENDSYSWASQDKLCRIVGDSIEVMRYAPWNADAAQRIQRAGDLRLERPSKSCVAASVALFGTVVEFESSLLVIPSTGSQVVLKGEPVNWRVFPRSKHYENHLHVVYDDHLAIFSFNQDYFVNQDEKISGIRHFEARGTTMAPLR